MLALHYLIFLIVKLHQFLKIRGIARGLNLYSLASHSIHMQICSLYIVGKSCYRLSQLASLIIPGYSIKKSVFIVGSNQSFACTLWVYLQTINQCRLLWSEWFIHCLLQLSLIVPSPHWFYIWLLWVLLLFMWYLRLNTFPRSLWKDISILTLWKGML